MLEGYDGAAWEYYGDPGVVLRTVAGAGALARHNAHQFIDPLVDAGGNGTTLADAGQRVVDGKSVYVRVRSLFGRHEESCVRRSSSFLIDGIEQDIQFHAFGKNVPTHIAMDDYKPVGGVLMPFRTRQIDDASGQVMDSSVTTSARANVGLQPAFFCSAQLYAHTATIGGSCYVRGTRRCRRRVTNVS